MWHRWLSAAGCGLALAPVGCFFLPKPETGVGKLTPFPPDLRSQLRADPGVTFDTRLLEQPVGESYLSRGLWADTTDPLPHHLSALLAANGVRVGLVSGPTPAEFDKLATGEGTAVAPTLRRGLAGKPKLIPVNGPLDRCTAGVTDALTADMRKLSLSTTECAVLATGTPDTGGRVMVRCELLLQHGDKRAWWTATDEGGFERTDERTKENFPSLVFEVSLAPSETLVIGPTANPDDTLGGVFFVTPSQAKQRVLVIRAKAEKE